jgi:hypothetical protein
MKRSIDLDAIRITDAKLAQLLADHPELCEPNNERQQALEAWLQSLDGEAPGPLVPPRSHNRITA